VTLHLSPYTLHPSPHTPPPAPPHAIHPEPCTLHPAPYTLHSAPLQRDCSEAVAGKRQSSSVVDSFYRVQAALLSLDGVCALEEKNGVSMSDLAIFLQSVGEIEAEKLTDWELCSSRPLTSRCSNVSKELHRQYQANYQRNRREVLCAVSLLEKKATAGLGLGS